jgi:hypothetical protein
VAPEYAMEGVFSVKSDVFSFVVLVLEILGGQRNVSFFFKKGHKSFIKKEGYYNLELHQTKIRHPRAEQRKQRQRDTLSKQNKRCDKRAAAKAYDNGRCSQTGASSKGKA